MMISTKGRYALRLMVDLASHQKDGFTPLKEIAHRQELSEKYLESIIKLLVQAHLLEGVRGKGGGYRLTLTPEEYTIGQILRLTEGPLSPVACLESEENDCPRADVCPTLPMWKKLEMLLNNFFDGITLAELLPDQSE